MKLIDAVFNFPPPPKPPNRRVWSFLGIEIETQESLLATAKYEGEQDMWDKCFALIKDLKE